MRQIQFKELHNKSTTIHSDHHIEHLPTNGYEPSIAGPRDGLARPLPTKLPRTDMIVLLTAAICCLSARFLCYK